LRQVVLLAAGMDTRAFRLTWPRGTRLYEVDRASQLARKAERLGSVAPRCTRIAVAADLAENWLTPLTTAGFEASAPTLWLLEGITMYFDADRVGGLLRAVSGASSAGSRLGVDFIGTAIVRPPHQQFGCDAPAVLVAPFGWRCTVVQPGEPAAHYGRWPHPVPPASVLTAHRAHFVTAERA
jgi:methyltransferase (TIGR00027 family)